jgi:hypothetical protein
MREKQLALTGNQDKMPINRSSPICSLTYLKVNFRNNAKKNSSSRFYLIFWAYTYPFWRYLFTPVLLQTVKIAEVITSPSAISPEEQSVQHQRRDAIFDLSHHTQSRKNRDNSPLKTKWGLPILYRITYLSQSHDLETLPPSHGSMGSAQIKETPRPAAPINDFETKPSHQGDIRSGFHRPYPLWQTGNGPDRLQPQKVGPPLLSSSSLFQWNHQGFLAWGTSPWRYPYGYRDRRVTEGILCQIASLCKDRNYPSRQGFYDHENIEYLESEKALFVIVAKLTTPVKRRILNLSYQIHSSGLETEEFMYQPTRWKKEYRFVVVRRPIPEDPTEQLTLFSMGKYSYQVVVTNIKLTPLNTWKFYNGRAAVELIIKELKGDYHLGKIPTKYFVAKEAYFHTFLFFYNLINWFKRLSLTKEFQNMTLKTLRVRLLLIPGELIRSGNKRTLKLPANFLYRDAFEYAIKKIENLKI